MNKEEVIKTLLDCGSVSCRIWLNITLEEMMIVAEGRHLTELPHLGRNVGEEISYLPNLRDRIIARLTLHDDELAAALILVPITFLSLLPIAIQIPLDVKGYIFGSCITYIYVIISDHIEMLLASV